MTKNPSVDLASASYCDKVISKVDRIVFLKKGYSFFLLLIPFAIISLFYVVLSVQNDNLLIKLLPTLQKQSTWLPAGFLTIFSITIYILTLKAQIQESYLRAQKLVVQTAVTSALYLIVCSALVYWVLLSQSGDTLHKTPQFVELVPVGWGAGDLSSPETIPTWTKIWACLLVSALSLTGMGWSKPDSWIKYLTDKFPNYLEAHLIAGKVKDMIHYVGSKEMADQHDVTAFSESMINLRQEIEKNLQKEPKWAKEDLHDISNKLRKIHKIINNQFPLDNINQIKTFSGACRLEGRGEFQGRLRELITFWPEWQFGRGS
jgi:hypothetical protein